MDLPEPLTMTHLFSYWWFAAEMCLSWYKWPQPCFSTKCFGKKSSRCISQGRKLTFIWEKQPRTNMMVSHLLHLGIRILIFQFLSFLSIYNIIMTYFFIQDDKANLLWTVKCSNNISSSIIPNLFHNIEQGIRKLVGLAGFWRFQ